MHPEHHFAKTVRDNGGLLKAKQRCGADGWAVPWDGGEPMEILTHASSRTDVRESSRICELKSEEA